MEEITARALNVIRTNPEWIDSVKNFNEPDGFLFSANPIIDDIKLAIEQENPIHSGASIALCLQQCRQTLNQPAPHYRVFH
jgi:hypothetical protein